MDRTTKIGKFKEIIYKIEKLEKYDQYDAALIFGSVANGDHSQDSDLDVIVITKEDRSFSILHPFIGNIKLDLTYRSLSQLKAEINDQIKKKLRRPMVVGCKILFDKTGNLTEYVEEVNNIKPSSISIEEERNIRFMIYHSTNKMMRNIEDNPETALLSLHTSLDELLKYHYRIQKKWFVSSKKVMKDLKKWDLNLYNLLSRFLYLNDPKEKFYQWNKMVNYVLAPLGGIKLLNEDTDLEFQDDINLLLI